MSMERKANAKPFDHTFWGGVGTFAFFAIFGAWISLSAWDGMVYVSDLQLKGVNGRVPAAIRKDLDFSRLNGAELMSASQKRLLTAARVISNDANVGIEFGQFIIRSEEGQRQLACDFYDRVRVRFEADGMAVSGDKPQMEVNAPCATSTDLALTEPIWIPTDLILRSEATDGTLSFPEVAKTSFKFSNVMQHWPRRWAVTEVTLYREEDPKQEIHVDQSDMYDLKRQQLIVVWPKE